MTILDDNNNIVCTCPLQLNKVWLFPTVLMTPPATLLGKDISRNEDFPPTNSNPPLLGLPFHLPTNPIHFTKEMILRATQARELHEFLCHPSDSAMKLILNQGTIAQFSHLTAADVNLMTQFYGSCLSCQIGKAHYHDLHVTSTTSPSTFIGQRVFFDLQLLPSPSRGGNTQAVIFIDDYSRFITVLGAKSKLHQDIMVTIHELVSLYNSEGYAIKSFCSDAEPICQSLTFPIGFLQSSITFTTPDAHCHKVERAIQQIDQKVVAVLAAMPYVLPPHLILYAKKYCADSINLTPQSTLSSATSPYLLFYKKKPTFNSDSTKSFIPFGAACLVKFTDGQRTTIASNSNLNLNNVTKAGVAINLGTSPNHPGDNIFYQPSNNTIIFRNSYEKISAIPSDYQPQPIIQQTYITTSSPSYTDIITNDDYPHGSRHISNVSNDIDPTSTVSSDDSPPEKDSSADHSNEFAPAATKFSIVPNLVPHDSSRRYPLRTPVPHPNYADYDMTAHSASIPTTTKHTLAVTTSQKSEFSIKKGYLMESYKHAVGPAIHKELTKMFKTYQALEIVDRSTIPPNAVFYRFFLFLKLKFLPDTTFERMSARLCAMEVNSASTDSDTAYAATGDHHLFLLAVVAILADAIKNDYLHLVELRRYDIPGAFLQCPLTPTNCPNPLYGILPPDLPAPFANKYVHIKRGVYGAKVSNAIFDKDHSETLVKIGFQQFIGDRCKFLLVCPTDPILKIIINTHVDDGGVILTWRTKYDEVLYKLNQRYPGTLDESTMDRYLGMGFHFNSQTGALTATMLHSVTKLLATACTEALSPQPTPHTLDLFHPSTDTTPVDPKTYQQIVGMMIYLLKVRSDIHLPVIMAATHNAAPTQGDLTKLIRILAYLKATPDLGPTFHTRGGAILVAHCDAAFAVHTSTGGSHFSISLSIGEDSAPYHVISRAQTTKISLNPTHSEYSCASLTTELVKFDRTFCDWILLPQSAPTVIKTDSAPSIATALAPNFPRHSKNLLVEYHNVREAIAADIIRPVHVLSKGFMADLNAKPTGTADFIAKRSLLLNVAANPTFVKYL